MDLIKILEKTVSPDTHELESAQQFLESAAAQNLPELLKSLSDILKHGGNSPVARMQAGLQLKNALYSKDNTIKLQHQQRWLQFPEEIRNYIKQNVLDSLGNETVRPSSAAQCVAYIACAELPNRLWPDLIGRLTTNVINAASTEMMKEATLEAVDYIYQEIEPEILQPQSNEILTAIVHAMKEEPSNHVQLAATNALLNSLEFMKANFDQEAERHLIMQVTCEATQSTDTRVRVAAMQCLVKIMSLYYIYMTHYMDTLFTITIDAMEHNNEEIALQAIEFWSTVCDEEVDLAIELSEATEQGRPPERTSMFYAKGALQYLVPILLVTLAKQDDDDEWNPCKAAGVCLMLMATCCEDDVVPHVLPFVRDNIRNEDWRFRDAAVMAFGSILEGPDPDKMKPIVEQAMPMLIELLKDPSVVVRDTAAWIVGRVCELLPDSVLHETCLTPLLNALVAEPRVASNVGWGAIQSTNERVQYYDLQSLLCATLQSMLRKVTPEDALKISDQIMTALLRMLKSTSGKAGGVQEDALLAMSTLIEVLGEMFQMYMEAFKPYLLLGLKNHAEYQVCLAAVGIVGDLCRALGANILPHCDELMMMLLENLGDENVHRSVKPQILSVFRDIALAIGTNFKDYLDVVMNMLQQASQAQVDKNDYDMIDYLNELRERCIEPYTGIVQGFKGDEESPNHTHELESAQQFLESAAAQNLLQKRPRREVIPPTGESPNDQSGKLPVFLKEIKLQKRPRREVIPPTGESPNDQSGKLPVFLKEIKPELLKSSSDILKHGGNSPEERRNAFLQLKNALYSKDNTIKLQCQQRWLQFPEEIRNYIKKNVLDSLGNETVRPSSAAQILAYIAYAELPHRLWPDLIDRLNNNMINDASTEMMKEATQEAVGYICQEIEPEILTAIVHAVKKKEPRNHVRLAATKALPNSLEFTKAKFDQEAERHLIMQVTCEATQSTDTRGAIQSTNERVQYYDLQSLPCATLQSMLRNVTPEDAPNISGQIMTALLRMFQSTSGKAGGVQEDALLAMSTLIEVLDEKFQMYMEAFKPYLLLGLKNHAEYQVCLAAVGIVGDLCRALGANILPHCDELMMMLLENLGNEKVHRSLKPKILSVFSDIALAIGTNFKDYLDMVMNTLQQASQAQVDKTDYELREGCLEAYTGIVHGLKGDGESPNPDVVLMQQHVGHVVSFIEHIAADEDKSDSDVAACCGLIGDLCSAFGSSMLPMVDRESINNLLTQGRRSKMQKAKTLATWATKEIRRLKSAASSW